SSDLTVNTRFIYLNFKPAPLCQDRISYCKLPLAECGCISENLKSNAGYFTVSITCFNDRIKGYNSRVYTFISIYINLRIDGSRNILNLQILILVTVNRLQILRNDTNIISLCMIYINFCTHTFTSRVVTKII